MRRFSVFRASGGTAPDISIRIVSLWLTVLLAATVVSCSHDPGSAPREVVDPPPVVCYRPLTEHGPFGDCPATFAEDGWKANVCRFSPAAFTPNVSERTCDGYRARSFGFGTHSWGCYYDATTLPLVGADYADDVPDLCNSISSYEVLGSIPTGNCMASVMLDMPCGPLDGGAEDGSHGGGQ
jgi:hypothetical protein